MKQGYRYGLAGVLLFLLGVLGLRAGDVRTTHAADEAIDAVSHYTYDIATEDEAPQGFSSSVFSCGFKKGLRSTTIFSSSCKSNAARLSCSYDGQGKARLCQAFLRNCLLRAVPGAVDYYIFALRKIQV